MEKLTIQELQLIKLALITENIYYVEESNKDEKYKEYYINKQKEIEKLINKINNEINKT